MSTLTAPVVLMGYRRPEHTKKVFEAIKRWEPSTLFLIMDGPRPGDYRDEEMVRQTRVVVEEVDWDCSVHRIYAETNLGLKDRVSSGLDQVFDRVDRAIILEDDCLPAQSFFQFSSELLERYQNDPRVGLVSGSQRIGRFAPGTTSYLFSRDVRIWGWATWRRTWQSFRQAGALDAKWSSSQARILARQFAPGARRQAMRKMMARAGNLDSWALPFAVFCVTSGYLNPVAGKNLIQNIGLGGDSTHTAFENFVVDVPLDELEFPIAHPQQVAYTFPIDEIESLRDAAEVLRYPIFHPVDTFRRLARFAKRVRA